MKIFIVILCTFLLFVSCEKPSDCIETTGAIISRDYTIEMPTAQDSIKRIYVERGIELVVTQGPIFKIMVQTGENLINAIDVKREGTTLYLKDNTTCNWVREYGQTKVYVTTPNLEDIYSKTERNISSNGILTFPVLRLFALDQDADGKEGAGTNDFFIQVNNNQLVIESNNVARFYVSGQTDEGLFNFYEGNSRIEAQNLQVKNIKVFHRGANDMIVRPTESITGKMVSTGNIILKNTPPVVNVQQLYQGHIIYN